MNFAPADSSLSSRFANRDSRANLNSAKLQRGPLNWPLNSLPSCRVAGCWLRCAGPDNNNACRLLATYLTRRWLFRRVRPEVGLRPTRSSWLGAVGRSSRERERPLARAHEPNGAHRSAQISAIRSLRLINTGRRLTRSSGCLIWVCKQSGRSWSVRMGLSLASARAARLRPARTKTAIRIEN